MTRARAASLLLAGILASCTAGAAPQQPMLLKKAGITTVIAIILFTIVYLVVTKHLMPHQIFDLVPNLNQ